MLSQIHSRDHLTASSPCRGKLPTRKLVRSSNKLLKIELACIPGSFRLISSSSAFLKWCKRAHSSCWPIQARDRLLLCQAVSCSSRCSPAQGAGSWLKVWQPVGLSILAPFATLVQLGLLVSHDWGGCLARCVGPFKPCGRLALRLGESQLSFI